MTTTALIGHTGFVGSNLCRQHTFDATFNSTNIEQIAGRAFDLIVCAGAPAEKWKANADPEADHRNVSRLLRALSRVDASCMVLISTVDVFRTPVGVDEDTPVTLEGLHAYGRNRRLLEEVVENRFDALVLRLPGLYGRGLKKNIIYDFLHDNDVQKVDSRGVFQFYALERLWSDIEIALEANLDLVHLATEPVSVADVAREAFGREFVNEVLPSPPRYDVRTKHAALFGASGAYIETRREALDGIRRFVESQ